MQSQVCEEKGLKCPKCSGFNWFVSSKEEESEEVCEVCGKRWIHKKRVKIG